MFPTLGSRHPLSKSIVFDNCGALHLVNTMERLVAGSFVPSDGNEHVGAGTTSFPISGKGKWHIRNTLTGLRSERTEDLILENVAVVGGFHVNIISEYQTPASHMQASEIMLI